MATIDFNLKGKTALVTGASRGIGEAVARTLAGHGAQLILASRKIDDLTRVEEAIRAAGGRASSIACNTGDMAQIEKLFNEIKEKHKKLDILVNNAATNPYFGDVLGADEGVWDKTLAVNLKGYFFVGQHAARMMKETGGAIVNVASVNGIRPAPFQGIYSITKAGVIAMTKSFAKELASYRIRVNALLPGLTDTKFSSVMTKNEDLMKNVLLPTIPMGRIGTPEEMAAMVLYLVSDAASFTTGACFIVDGGMLA